jgi:hypothetical protein
LFVILFACCFTDGATPFIGIMHFLAFALNLAALIVGVTTAPFTNDCVGSSFVGCQILKSAIAIAGVLMYLY